MARLQLIVHVIFGHSAAAGLRDALALAGRDDAIALFPDDLRFGPIDSPELGARAAWAERELGLDYLAELAPDLDAFWCEALREDVRLVAWCSRRAPLETLGLMAWLERLGDRPCEVVDLTDVSSERGPPWPLPLIRSEEIVKSALWNLARPLAHDTREHLLAIWRRLQREDAPLRVLGLEGLVSAPITYFDEQLLGHVGRSWQRAAYVVGSTLADHVDALAFQTGDLVLFSRLYELVDLGRLEARGNPERLRTYEVRLPKLAAR